MTLRRGYEIFELCGSLGGSESIARARLRAEYGDGYGETALFGAKSGLKTWRLKFNVLPQALGGYNATFDGETISRADYLYEFWNRFDATGEPFIFQPQLNGQYYLAEFIDTELNFEQILSRLWTTGIAIRQRRVSDKSVYDPVLTPRGSRFYNVAELNYANNSSVTTLNDDIGNNDLAVASSKPTYKTNIQNGNGIIRFSGSNNGLVNTADFNVRHLFIVAKHSEAAFDEARNLVALQSDILTAAGEFFYDLGLVFPSNGVTVKVNGAVVAPDVVPVPYNTFKLYEIRFDTPFAATSLTIGASVDFPGSRRWKGDLGDIFISEKKMFEPDVYELEEEIMRNWGIH